MQQHPDHYSLPMRLLGSNAVAWMQEKGLGAEVWFNVDVEINGKVRCARRLTRVKLAVLTWHHLLPTCPTHSRSSTA